MALSDSSRQHIKQFREWLVETLSFDCRFGSTETLDRPDESTLALRWSVGESLWCEVAVRPYIPQVRIGILTDDRWKSEEMEDGIEDSGDEMTEFVGLAFCEVGLDWEEPLVEHYRDQGKWFYFATPLELKDLSELAGPLLKDKVRKILEGYYHAFQSFGKPKVV